ncbi:MAG: UDPGP type 1 family protein [Planctomycetota bacterium]|nr:UDPGP type 1 family protein [Planctomycetota bacterium]
MTVPDELRERFESAGQGHVLAHVDSLDAAAAARFAAELEDVDLDLVARLAALLEVPDGAASDPSLEPCPVIARSERAEEARSAGERALAAGEVGFVLVAGGQGSRLGFDGPKGAFPVGPVSGRTLFDWHAGRILAAARRHGFRPIWAVMTSRTNDADTRAFFAEHDHFGMPAEDVWFFSQDMLPALDTDGRILLSGPGELFLAPNGHGGTLQALSRSGVLARFVERGVKTLSYFQVDNPLARPADPVFVGHHVLQGAEMSSKVVAKRDSMEKVGVIGLVDGVLGCIEYMDLSEELREAKTPEGVLLFNAGNIAVHMIDCGFVARLNAGGDLDLPWHVARKRIATIDDAGAATEVDGVKFETFVFDALGRARASVTLEVDRAEEFSPVKNAEGSDSPETCRADLTRIGGGIIGRDGDAIEVDPRAAESAAEFAARGLPVLEQPSGLLVEPGA